MKLTKWYALDEGGDMRYVGEFSDFHEADCSMEYSCVWLADEKTAQAWLAQLTELLPMKSPYKGNPLKVGDRIKFVRSVGPMAQKGMVCEVSSVDHQGVRLAGGFLLFGPSAVTQYSEGRTWVRVPKEAPDQDHEFGPLGRSMAWPPIDRLADLDDLHFHEPGFGED